MSDKGQDIFHGREVLVLGAGYLGGEVARRLQAGGARVTALTRNPATCAALAASGVACLQADLASTDWHDRAGDADFVLVCAAAGGGGVEAYRHSYVGGLRSVGRWASTRRVGTLVYTSSTSVYPQGGGVVVDEASPVAEAASAATDPAGVLVEAEGLALGLNAAGCRSFVLRLAGIYGPGRQGFIDRLREAPLCVPGEAEGHLNLVHRDDIISAVLACWRAPADLAGQVFNVADEGRATRGEIAGWLARRLGLPAVSFTGRAAGGRRRLTPDRIVSAERIHRTLGWRPTYPSFREGYGALLEA